MAIVDGRPSGRNPSSDPVRDGLKLLAKLTGKPSHDYPACAIFRGGKCTCDEGADDKGNVNPAAALIDCEGASPCSTCPDKRECGRAGCVRIAQRRNAMKADAGSAAIGGAEGKTK